MLQFRNILALAFRDFSHEWRMSACFILALATVLAPMMILFGLKFGIVSAMLEQLVENPRNREIKPLGSGHYTAEWFEQMAARQDVAFIVPNTRALAATIELKHDNSPNIVSADMIPSGEQDPLLAKLPRKPSGFDEVVLSESAASRLKVNPGDVVDGSIARHYRDQQERVHLPLKVVAVARASSITQSSVFASLELLVAAENFRDGRAVPALGWQGDPPTSERRAFPTFRLYAETIGDVTPLSEGLAAQGLKLKTNTADIDLMQSIDRNLAIIFWIIALAGMSGFAFSLGASLWANVDRKRRELSVLRLVGFKSGGIVLFPAIQALLTGLFGWLFAILIYLIVEQVINRLMAPQLDTGQIICFLLPKHFLGALALTLLSAFLAALLGGFRAARIEPSDGLREI
jgi:putative ABC transport system permease protein